jgi:hypothetical protein
MPGLDMPIDIRHPVGPIGAEPTAEAGLLPAVTPVAVQGLEASTALDAQVTLEVVWKTEMNNGGVRTREPKLEKEKNQKETVRHVTGFQGDLTILWSKAH